MHVERNFINRAAAAAAGTKDILRNAKKNLPFFSMSNGAVAVSLRHVLSDRVTDLSVLNLFPFLSRVFVCPPPLPSSDSLTDGRRAPKSQFDCATINQSEQ
jgi:hypothetical protein